LSVTPEIRQRIYELRTSDPPASWKEIYDQYPDIPQPTLRRTFQREQNKRRKTGKPGPSNWTEEEPIDEPLPQSPHEQVTFTVDGDTAVAISQSPRIQTLDQLLETCKADLNLWRVKRYVVNVWEIGRKHKVVDLTWNDGVMDGSVQDDGDWNQAQNWQVKAWFEPREDYPFEQALDGLLDKIADYSPVYKVPIFRPDIEPDYLAVVNIYDAHIGKRSYDSSYTVEQAARDFVRVATGMASRMEACGRRVNRILFPVGHDILHADNVQGTTTKGTWVEMSADLRDAIDAVCYAVPRAVELFATIAPVDIVPVESNHDRVQVHWIARFLDAFFRNHPNVHVRTRRGERQYYQWGRVGLGLTHEAGKAVDMANVMAVEAREMWGQIDWSEWLTGHIHKERGALYAVDSSRGTVVRTIPAMCDLDNYHLLHLYVGNHRAAECIFYHAQDGPADSFPVFVSELN
jgi:hypothetical protein